MAASNDGGYQSSINPGSNASDEARIAFVVRALLGNVRTNAMAKVVSVTNDGGVAPIGFVDVSVLVGQVDGEGNVIPHGVIYNAPYMRVQGGENAIILDPEVGDVGLIAICDRDSSIAKKTAAACPPGSRRSHDMSDAVYLMTIRSAAPTRYIQVNGSGITIHAPDKVTISAPVIEATATTSATITAPTINATAATSASITAPSIFIGNTGQTLKALINQEAQTIYNGHHHPISGSNTLAPIQQMGSSTLTTTLKGG